MNPLEHQRILADSVGFVITLIRCFLCKYLMLKYLEARGVEPLFFIAMSSKIQERLYPRGFREIKRHGNAWMPLDVISFVIGWPAFGDIRNRSIATACFRAAFACGRGPSASSLGFGHDVFNLTIGHHGQAREHATQISVWFDAVAPAAFASGTLRKTGSCKKL